jgi:hypothetical protein
MPAVLLASISLLRKTNERRKTLHRRQSSIGVQMKPLLSGKTLNLFIFFLVGCHSPSFAAGATKRRRAVTGFQKIADKLDAIRFHRDNTFGSEEKRSADWNARGEISWQQSQV